MIIVEIIAILVIIGILSFLLIHGRKEFLSFKQAMDLVGLPVVTMYIGSKKLNFLLDTGCNKNIINSDDLKGIKYDKVPVTSVIFGLDGIKRNADNVSLKLFLYKKEIEDRFQVTDMTNTFRQIKQEYGVTINGIIGSSLFNKYKCVLDFDKMIFYNK